MPRLSSFYGIAIAMFWGERNHPLAHFHAEYGEHAASIALDGTVLAGSLPPRALRLVREWAQLHEDELGTNWERAQRHEPLVKIDPLP
jgi:Domain of unknown function (DUF4160)